MPSFFSSFFSSGENNGASEGVARSIPPDVVQETNKVEDLVQEVPKAAHVENSTSAPAGVNNASKSIEGSSPPVVPVAKEDGKACTTAETDSSIVERIPGNPPTSWELGKAGWNILHSAAAVYPYKPSSEQKSGMQQFIEGFSYAYACSTCAYHMRLYLRSHPPEVEDKHAVSKYMCRFHNHVNTHLQKPSYDCDNIDLLLKRWHPGYPDQMEDQPSWEERMAAAAVAKEALPSSTSPTASSSPAPSISAQTTKIV